jgi:hypothetical protein
MKAMMAIATAAALATMGMIEGVARAEPARASDASCAAREASVYFAPGGAELNAFSKQIIDRIAADAKACGRAQVAADAPNGAMKAQRMGAIASAFAADGVHLAALKAAPSAAKAAYAPGETMTERTAVLRLIPTH